MKYYKWVNKGGHYGMVYKEGLNTDPQPFFPEGDCSPGGIYFSREDILAFMEYGPDLYEVKPVGEVYENPGSPKKWKAHQVKLKYVGDRSDPKVIERLIKEGADIHIYQEEALSTAAYNGDYKVVQLLIKLGANINVSGGFTLCNASRGGHLEIVQLLLDAGADVHAHRDGAILSAVQGVISKVDFGMDTVKLLLEAGADLHAQDDTILQIAVKYEHLGMVKFFLERAGTTNTASIEDALGLAALLRGLLSKEGDISEIVSLLKSALLKGLQNSTLE